MDVKNDLSGGKPTLLIAEDEESFTSEDHFT